MGYFDSLGEGSFKKDASNKTLFFPWGVFGLGFVIDSTEKEYKIRKFVKNFYLLTIPSIIIIYIILGIWANIILLVIFYAWYYFSAKRLTDNLVISKERLGILEYYGNSARVASLMSLIILEVGSIAFVLAGFWILWSEQNSLLAYSAIGFFGLCAITIGYMIFSKVNSKRGNVAR